MTDKGIHFPNRHLEAGELERIVALGCTDFVIYIDWLPDWPYWLQVVRDLLARVPHARIHVRLEKRGNLENAADEALEATTIINHFAGLIWSFRWRNEINHPDEHADQATPVSWRSWLEGFINVVKFRTTVRVYVPAVSPGSREYQGFLDATIDAAKKMSADGVDCHAYGDPAETAAVIRHHRDRWSGKILVSEHNFGAGRTYDLDKYARELPETFRRAGEMDVEALCLFIWQWHTPPPLPTTVNVRDTPIEKALTDLKIVPTPEQPTTPTPPPEDANMEFPFATTLYSCPNHNATPDTTRDLLIMHSTRSGRSLTPDRKIWTHEDEYNSTVGYFMQPGSNSADAIVSPTRVALMQGFDGPLVMWHGGYNNGQSNGIEVTQAKPTTPYVDAQYRRAAYLARQYCLHHGIPMRRVMDENLSGIIGHEDTAQGKAGGKSDPGTLWDWVLFIKYVNDPNLFVAPPVTGYNILGFQAWLNAQPAGEYGAPRHDARDLGDGSGDLFLRLTPTTKHPDGPYLVYRKFIHDKTGDLLKSIRPVTWV